MLRVVYGHGALMSNFVLLFIHILKLAVLSEMHRRNCFPFAGPTVYEHPSL